MPTKDPSWQPGSLLAILLGLWLFSSGLQAAAPSGIITLSLEDAVVLGLRNNPQVRIDRLNRTLERFRFNLARDAFTWQHDVHGRVGQLIGATQGFVKFPEYGIEYRGHRIGPYGTELGIQLYGQNEGPRPQPGVTLSLKQPLLHVDREWKYRTALDAQQYDELARLQVASLVSNQILQTILMYQRILQERNQTRIYEDALKDAQHALRHVEARIHAGDLAPNEQVAARSEVSQQQLLLLQHRMRLRASESNFLELLGLEGSPSIRLSSLHSSKKAPPDVQGSMAIALTHHRPYLEQKIKIRLLERALHAAEAERRAQVDLHIQGNIGERRNASGALTRASQAHVGLDLHVPINEGPREEAVISSRVLLEQERLRLAWMRQSMRRSIEQQLDIWRSTEQQVRQCEEGVRLLQHHLDVSRTRQKLGVATSFETNTLRGQWVSKQIECTNLKLAHQGHQHQFEHYLGTTLEHWNIRTFNEEIGREASWY